MPKDVEIIGKSNFVCLSSVLLFCIVTFLVPILFWGLPDGFDLWTDLRFASAFSETLKNGGYFPVWANDNFGYGSIGIRFYPPLAFYGLALAHLATGDWFTAFCINLTFWMCLGCVGVYFFVRQWGTPVQAMAAGMIYAIVPQHLVELYTYFLYAEFAAWGITPFVFWFVTRVCRGKSWTDVFLFAISYSLLILTHIPTTIIVSICLPIYVLALMDWKRYGEIFSKLAIAVALTLTATSFSWIKIVTEFKWLAHNNPKWSTGKYGFSAWLFPNILIERSSYLQVLGSWLLDITIFLTIFLVIPGFIYLFISKTKNDPGRKTIFAVTITATFAFFMLSKPSLFVWNSVEFLQKIQFPWRWLSILSLMGIIAFSLSIPRLIAAYRSFARFIVYPALVLIVAIVLFDITQVIVPMETVSQAKFDKADYELRSGPIFEGWWTVWAKEAAFENKEQASAGNRRVEIAKWNSTDREFTVHRGEPANLRVSTFYYPYWKAIVNGQEAKVEKDDNGVILIPVQGEISKVKLHFEEPPLYEIMVVFSQITWLFFLFFIFSHSLNWFLSAQKKIFFAKDLDSIEYGVDKVLIGK